MYRDHNGSSKVSAGHGILNHTGVRTVLEQIFEAESSCREGCKLSSTGGKKTYVSPAAYTVAEFCEAFRISRGHFYNLIKKGVGPPRFHVGRRTLIAVESAEDWRRGMEAIADGTNA